ncbi:MAG: hypothetical protein K2M06_03665 [Muribaculaceae bacterium]|nr:hypothetical protein [Muribaculaceae bacterium]
MRILLLGDASNYHRALSGALVRMGHDVTLASDGGGWMHTGCDIDISRPEIGGRLGGALLWLKMRNLLRRDLRGYDVVQIASPGFAHLRPRRLRAIFDELRRENGSVFLSALGTDAEYVRALTGPRPPLGYSEWNMGERPTAWAKSEASQREIWLSRELTEYTAHFYSHIDGVVSALYEYHKVLEATRPELALAYGGIPIELRVEGCGRKLRSEGPLRIYLAAHKGREAEKGADILFPLVREFAASRPGEVEVLEPANMAFADFLKFLEGVDVLVDQLYSYTPATSALLAMSRGVVAVSGAEPEFGKFIGEEGPLPLINASPSEPEGFLRDLGRLADDSRLLADTGRRAEEFVKRHNSADIVARRFTEFWQSRLK